MNGHNGTPITIEKSGAFIQTIDIRLKTSGQLKRLKFAVKDLIDVRGHNVSSFPVHERRLHDVTNEVIKSLCLKSLRRCEGCRKMRCPHSWHSP